jgi:hypothetical protein
VANGTSEDEYVARVTVRCGGEELSLRDASQSALMASVLDRAIKGEL